MPSPPDALDEGFILPLPVAVVLKAGMTAVNVITRRRFTVLRRYVTKEILFTEPMWILGLGEEEYMASETNLHNPKLYRLVAVEEFDDYDSPAYRIYLPRPGVDD